MRLPGLRHKLVCWKSGHEARLMIGKLLPLNTIEITHCVLMCSYRSNVNIPVLFFATKLQRNLQTKTKLALPLVSFRLTSYTVLTSPSEGETALHGYGPPFISSCRVGVSQSHLFLRSIGLAVMLYVSSFIRLIRSLQ